jgi:hypothetical protein
MHTARQLSSDLFEISIDGAPASRELLLPDWQPLDRIGIVVHSPYGLFGASHLIQLSITSFYDIRPERREGTLKPGEEDPKVIYPEHYIFHVGGPWGDVSAMDFWPPRKEVFLPDDPRVVLDAINDRGITRLLVPSGEPCDIEHVWTEPAAARDRIRSAFLYSSSGRVGDADVEVVSREATAQANIDLVLDTAANIRRVGVMSPDEYADDDLRERSWAARAARRMDERAQDRGEVARTREDLVDGDGSVRETYRRIDVNSALRHLATCPRR